MKALLLGYWDHLRSSFWFVPSLMAVSAAALAFGMVALDTRMSVEWVKGLGWVYSGGAEGASAVLGTVAGSMITIAGLVFSLTLVALSVASSQLGPRLLRNFMRDTTNQLALGTFVSTFLYCLLVLRTIRRAEESVFVPYMSVTLGVVLALVNLWVLLYFIHHVSMSIQADEIIARVSAELRRGIDQLFPEHVGGGEGGQDQDEPLPASALAGLPDSFDQEAGQIRAVSDGYLQMVDGDALMSLARAHDVVMRVERRPGQYVVGGSALVSLTPASAADEDMIERVQTAFVLGSQRTPIQDFEFSVHQLAEIASRALSPGINDPFTAVACIDRLTSALARLAGRAAPSPFRRDEDGTLRVVAYPVTFAGVMDAAFHQIRQYSRGNVPVTIRLLEALAVIAPTTRRAVDRAAVRRHADMVVRGARAAVEEPEDLKEIEERYEAVERA